MNERDKNREKLEFMLNEWNDEFDKLEAKMRNAGADPKVHYDDVIKELRQHRYKA
jgi:hypothetical protein